MRCFWRFWRARRAPPEAAIAIKTLEERHNQGLEDLAWSLINKPEFLYDY